MNSRRTAGRRKPDNGQQEIYEQLCAMPIVDAHEHLHAEDMRVSRNVDIFLRFHQYLNVDLIGAGMDEAAADAFGEPDVPLDQKWDSIAPYLDIVRNPREIYFLDGK